MMSMLTPVLALIVLTLLGLDLAIRHPHPGDAVRPKSRRNRPAIRARSIRCHRPARQVTDNYNHLLEQPTIFYALVFYIVLSGH